MPAHRGTPKWQHNCANCTFLGQTIGGGQLVDLYVHEYTLIARYGHEGPQYWSTDVNYAHATGHSELFAASYLWRNMEEGRYE